ncbi:MAG TPA: hypothetical protein VMQ67_02000, partial [Candidatus Saccharimonadales bacterium]|nr:hypothetical protein [Candidatus Saccharimonadales bacterium]
IQNDNGVAVNIFNNYGLFEKTGGSATSVISGTFNNSGVIQPGTGSFLEKGSNHIFARFCICLRAFFAAGLTDGTSLTH